MSTFPGGTRRSGRFSPRSLRDESGRGTLLVVDDNEDNEDNRDTLTNRLKRLGYADVVTSNDGQQALELPSIASRATGQESHARYRYTVNV